MLSWTEVSTLSLGILLATIKPIQEKNLKGTLINLLGTLGLGLGLLTFYGNNFLFLLILPVFLWWAGVVSYVDLKSNALPNKYPAISIAITLLSVIITWNDWLSSPFMPTPIHSFSLIVAFFVVVREVGYLLLEREGIGDADSPIAPLYFSLFPFPYSFYGILLSVVSSFCFLLLRKRAYTPLIPFFLLGSAMIGLFLALKGY